MSAENEMPAIRFKGFSREWEERELGTYAKFRRGSFPQPYGNREWYGGEGAMPFVQVVDVTKKLTLVKDTKQKISIIAQPKSVLVEKGKVLVTLQGSIGRVAIAQYNTYVDRTLLIFEAFEKKTNSHYWAYLIQNKFDIEKRRAPGGIIKTITKEALSTFRVNIPEHEEQTKIGNYFQQLDRLITQHQQKHDKLLNLKKALLEKMFPKQGATVPEIRFKAFSGEWEEKMLGQITASFSGGTPQVGNEEYYKGDIPFIRSGEINSNSTELFISDLGLKNSSARLVNVGCILYALYGATSGEVGLSKINGAINQAILAIIPHSEISSGFVMQWLRKNKAQIIGTYLQGGQGNLSGTIVKNLVVDQPRYEEQTKIGCFFKQLDTLINQHQTQLKKLNNIKKACLEKMFV